ncbi:hypothetical protein HK104_011063 [Borealophlyctis nickersoniae]|nr:hypothetical protein HK104_011063 [Borealophlyctis nickersoniae]
MDKNNIDRDMRVLFRAIIQKDTILQRKAIERFYDETCRLQTPIMILHGREEIIRNYAALSNSCIELSAEVAGVERADGFVDSPATITYQKRKCSYPIPSQIPAYDSTSQIATIDLRESLTPKVLGGLTSIPIHQILQLQLEVTDPIEFPNLMRVVHQREIHIAQDMLSQVPYLGSFYDGTLRTAIGHAVTTGATIVNAVGVLDLVPVVTRTAKGAVEAAGEKAVNVASAAGHGGVRLAYGLVGSARDALGWVAQRAAQALAEREAADAAENGGPTADGGHHAASGSRVGNGHAKGYYSNGSAGTGTRSPKSGTRPVGPRQPRRAPAESGQ